jgi:hypothetical protein
VRAGRNVGFVVERPLRAWVARAAEAAARTPGVDAVCVLALPGRRRRAGELALACYATIDRFVSRVQRDALAVAEPGRLAVIGVEGPAELIAQTERLDLDLLVDLTAREIGRSLQQDGCQAELWALRHGDVPAGAPHAVLREFAAGTQTCATTLLRLDPGAAAVLYRSQSFVRRLSLQRARNPIYWKSAAFVARALLPGAAAAELVQPGADCAPPTVRELSALQLRLGRRLCSFVHERLFRHPTWSIDWRAGNRRAESSEQFVPGGRIDPPRGEFYADPFVVDRDGRHYLFYEAYRHSLGRAELAVRELADGRAGPPVTIMARPYHLSYPFVFQWRDEHFLLPESAESGLVQLYRAVDFPGEWCVDTTLLEGVRAYDSTLVEHDGRYFLFAAIPEPGADIDELHLFWADDLRGPYRPHPQNPVVSDASRARPAGRVFSNGGRLIRPSQDGSRGYGSAIVLNEIVRLDPAGYAERPAGRIEATWDASARGTHTIDHDGAIEVVDVKLLRPRFARRPRVSDTGVAPHTFSPALTPRGASR